MGFELLLLNYGIYSNVHQQETAHSKSQYLSTGFYSSYRSPIHILPPIMPEFSSADFCHQSAGNIKAGQSPART